MGKDQAHGGGPTRSFGELVFASFAELIKDPKKYPQAQQAFHIAMDRMARDIGEATLAAVRGLDDKLDDITNGLDALAILRTGVARYLEMLPGIQRGVHRIDQRTKRIEPKIDVLDAKVDRIIAALGLDTGTQQIGAISALAGLSDDPREALRMALANYLNSDDPRGAEVADLLDVRQTERAREVAFALAEDQAAQAGQLGDAASEAAKKAAKSWRDAGAIAFLSDQDAAAAAYERALALDPVDPVAWRDLGRIYQWLNRLVDAQRAFRKIVYILPDGLNILIKATDTVTARDRFERWRADNSELTQGYLWSVRELVFAVVNLAEIARARPDLTAENDFFGDPGLLLERALALNGVLGMNEVEAINSQNLEVLAHMAMDHEHLAAAEEYLKRSLAVNEYIESEMGRASNLNNLGVVARMRGDPQAAEKYLRRSLAITQAERGDDCFHVGFTLRPYEEGANSDAENVRELLVPVAYREEFKQDPDKALRKMLQFLRLSAKAHGNLGALARERGDFAVATEKFGRTLEVHTVLDDKGGMATDLDNLALIAQKRGDLAAACALWEQSLALYREIGWTKAVDGISGRMRAAGCPDGSE